MNCVERTDDTYVDVWRATTEGCPYERTQIIVVATGDRLAGCWLPSFLSRNGPEVSPGAVWILTLGCLQHTCTQYPFLAKISAPTRPRSTS